MSALAPHDAQACRDLIVIAAHFQDTRDLAGFAACFCADGKLIRPSGEAITGPQAIEAAYRARDPLRITQHLILNQRVERQTDAPTGTQRAIVSSKVLLWTSHANQTLTPQGRQADPMQKIGEFEDELVQLAGQWKIAQRQARFLLFQAS